MLVITIQAIWGTMHGRGPFLAQTPSENALALQLFLLMAATPLMLLAVAINEERRSKDALRLTEERMSLAVESAQLAVWDWDMAHDQVWMADVGHTFFGFEENKPRHLSSLDVRVHPDDRALRHAAIQRALETSGSYDVEFRIILPDGSVRWIASRGRPASAVGDGASRMLGISMDVTHQKQASAEAQQQREELAHLSRVAALSALSSSLGHELSQPLASIFTDAHTGRLLLAQNAPDLPALHAIFADIIGASRRARGIIEGLRTMLRRGQVVVQPVDVNDSLDDLLRLTRSDLIARGVSVVRPAVGDIPLVVTDRVQLQQVLLNLIVNACDAMASNPPGDRVVTLTIAVVPGEVHIGVLDCGVGLPDDVATLFQPFHSTKSGGLGIGLSICRTLVTSHGGRLWAERRPGRGAAFYVALPLVAPPSSVPAVTTRSFNPTSSSERPEVAERSSR
jgi:PAS domain S-box-containing protein